MNTINHPQHYNEGNIECIDAIESALTPEEFQGFCKGNALKYTWRSNYKGSITENLKKAQWYTDRAIFSYENDPRINAIAQQINNDTVEGLDALYAGGKTGER